MADPILEFDPAAEATGTPLTITTGNYGLTQFSAPAPAPKTQWAGSIDTEGQRLAAVGHENRVISISLEVTGASALAALQDKLAKVHREGGTLKYTSPAGTVNTYDVLIQDGWTPVFDHLHYLGGVTSCSFSLTCKPYGRGAEVDLGDNTETTLPCLIFTEATVDGDVPALGRLLIDEDDAEDQWWVTWGLQSRYYSSSANAALFYEAEGRTALGGSATSASPSGGSGSSVMRNTDLLTTYQGIVSTQATGGGAHLSHVGTFRVYARVQASVTDTVTVAFEWAEGDFLKYTRNPETVISSEQDDVWRLVDLGLVSLRTITAGTQRWEGRIIAKASTAGDDLAVDYLMLIPVDEGSGIVIGVDREYTPSTFSVLEDFTSTTSGNALNGRTPPTGAAWATSGTATDFAFIDAAAATYNTTEAVSRSVSTTGERLALVGSDMTVMQVQAILGFESLPPSVIGGTHGIVARGIDTNNGVRLHVQLGTTTNSVVLSREVAGTTSIMRTGSFPAPAVSTLFVFTLTVTAGGKAIGVISDYTTGATYASVSATSSVLATGGALASGKAGITDAGNGTDTYERFWDTIRVIVPPVDAAMFASQSLEIRHDRVVREDSGGTLWPKVSRYDGDYLFVPPSGAEARTNRVVIKASRAHPMDEGDPGIDDISAKLFVTPRYLAPPA